MKPCPQDRRAIRESSKQDRLFLAGLTRNLFCRRKLTAGIQRRSTMRRDFSVGSRRESPVMSEQEIILPPSQPRREDARDLQMRLYREIALAAVEAALFATDEVDEPRAERAPEPVQIRRDAA
jgi:hypothetical protein